MLFPKTVLSPGSLSFHTTLPAKLWLLICFPHICTGIWKLVEKNHICKLTCFTWNSYYRPQIGTQKDPEILLCFSDRFSSLPPLSFNFLFPLTFHHPSSAFTFILSRWLPHASVRSHKWEDSSLPPPTSRPASALLFPRSPVEKVLSPPIGRHLLNPALHPIPFAVIKIGSSLPFLHCHHPLSIQSFHCYLNIP